MEAKLARKVTGTMRKATRGAVAGLLAILFTTGLQAQGPPINTDTAFVNGLEGAAFRSFVFSVRRSGLLEKGETVIDPLDREVTVYGIPIVVPYEVFRNRLVLAAGIPIVHKQMRLGEGEQRRTLSSRGFGDAFISTKLLVAQRDRPGQTTRIALSGAIKLPTGNDDEKDGEGNLLPPPLQLGSGSVDYTLGGVVTHVRRRVGFNADLAYHFRTEANDYAFGDSLAYNLSVGYRLLPAVYDVYPARNHLNAYLELNGTFSRKDQIGGVSAPNTGGNLISISPGIQLIPGNFLVEASLRLPVVQDLNGTQLKFRPGFNVGVRWLLY